MGSQTLQRIQMLAAEYNSPSVQAPIKNCIENSTRRRTIAQNIIHDEKALVNRDSRRELLVRNNGSRGHRS